MSTQNPGIKRAVLWNVEQPGDPYDIRKSMIAKLPEHPSRFMGDNLELVCLFQAAQIQRLAQFLDEMTLQMRSIERIQMDRHSYEVQIKELAEKVQLSSEYKNENSKLRQFIKGQSQQLQNLQRYRNSAQSLIELQTKYESVLNELRITRDNYESLRKANNESLTQMTQIKYKYERLEMNLSEQRLNKQRETRFAVEKALAENRHLYESKQYQLKGEITVMKENMMLKNQEITLEKEKNTALLRQLQEKDEMINKYMRGEIQIQSSTKTQQFLRISKRLQESTYLLQQKEKNIINFRDEISYLNKKLKQLQQDLRRKELQIKTKEQEYNNNNGPDVLVRMAEFEKKVIVLSSEVERLKEVVMNREREIDDREKQLVFYKDKAFTCEKNVQAMHRNLLEKQSIIKRMEFDFRVNDGKDGKIQALGNQISRLNNVLKEKLSQISSLEIKINELSQNETHHIALLRSKDESIRQLQIRIKDYEFKIISIQESNKLNFDEINRLNIKIASVQNQNIQLRREIESKTQGTSSQVAQLRIELSTLTQEVNDKTIQNKKLREDNHVMFNEIRQMQQKIASYENTFNQQRLVTNQRLLQKDRQLQQLQLSFISKQRTYVQKIDMYSKSMPKMSSQIERLHSLLEKRNQEIQRLQEDLDMQREKLRMIDRRNSNEIEMRILQYERNLSFYESKCKNYEKINNELVEEKNKVVEKLIFSENKLRETDSENEKIRNLMKSMQNASQDSQRQSVILQSTISQLREQNLRLQSESLKSRQELQLNFQFIKKLQYELDIHKRDLNKSLNQSSSIKEEFNRLKSVYDQKQRSNPALMHTIDELKHKLAKQQNQVQHLATQINERKRRHEMTEEENRSLKIKLNEYQESIKHTQQVNLVKMEEMKQRLLQEFDSCLNKENLRYNQLQEAYNQLQSNYQNTSVYFEDQGGRIESLHAQNDQLRRHLEQYQQKVFSYEERIALLSQEIDRLTMENNEYRNKLQKLHKDQSESKAIVEISSQLERTKIELTNLKKMLQEYESINQHAIAQRDQLFVISHEQQQKLNNYANQINRLNDEISALRSSQSSQTSSQLNIVKQQYNQIYIQFTSLQNSYQQVVSQLQNSKKRLIQLSSTTQVLHEKDLHTKQLEIRIHKITEQYQTALRIEKQRNSQFDQNMEKQSRAIIILQNENNSLRTRISELQEKITSQQEIEEQVEQLKTAYINIKLENEELNRMLEEMQEQLFDANEENRRISMSHQENGQLVQQNSNLRTTLEQEHAAMEMLRQKLSVLSTEIGQIKSQAEQRINSISSNYFSLEQQNINLKQQIESLQIEITQVSVYQEISAQLELKYNNLYQAYEQTYKIYNEMKIEYETVQENLRNAEMRVNTINQEFQKLNTLVVQFRNESLTLGAQNDRIKHQYTIRQTEFSNIIATNQDLEKELKRMYELNKDLTEQVKEIRLRLTDQHALEEKIKQHLVLFVMQCVEIDSLRRRVAETEQQCEEVRRSSISPIKGKR